MEPRISPAQAEQTIGNLAAAARLALKLLDDPEAREDPLRRSVVVGALLAALAQAERPDP